MLVALFQNARFYLNDFFDRVDLEEVQKVLERLLQCKGVVILSGVGKSGHIAQKLVSTLVSTGTRSLFLSPAQALHGDIGFVSAQEVVLFFSKSGETEELLELIPHVEKRGALKIAVVSAPSSRLERMSDLVVHLPVQRELCPHDLAPTTSTTVQLIFGDCLAVALMRAKNFTVGDFAANHPGGLLGRKTNLRVAELMIKGEAVPLCPPTAKLLEVLHELSAKRCGCLLVVDEEKRPLGIFTDGDLRRAIQKEGQEALHRPMEALMTRPFRATSPQRLAFEAMRQMEEDPTRLITTLPVIEEGRLVGLVRMHDILQAGLTC